MKRALFPAICVMAALSATPLDAQERITGCFERFYDKSHLSKHTGQLVTAIQLQIGVEGTVDNMFIKVVGKKGLFSATTKCRGDGVEASCENTYFSERFSVVRTKKGVKLSLDTPLTFGAIRSDTKVTLPKDEENQTYALVAVSGGSCADLNR